jgi:cyclopropane-fatty-acyl-phospholipid synthase
VFYFLNGSDARGIIELYRFMADSARIFLEKLLSSADIQINGSRPWDMRVHNEQVFSRIFRDGSLGVGESYMDGWWDCEQLDEFFNRIWHANLVERVKGNWRLLFHVAGAKFFNLQSRRRAFIVGEKHYDIGNDLFVPMLGRTMAYSCGYWRNAKSLDEAQEAKFDVICRKIGLKPGMKILDIGCGWGAFMKYAVEKYKVSAVGVTISKEQAAFAKELMKGLPIEIRLQDYRELNEKFDRIISIGMFEHVGYKNYREFMSVASRNLKDDGLFLLHTIGNGTSVTSIDPWINKYIFPNALLPSVAQISRAAENLFIVEDWHNFGADYDLTLMAWYHNFEKSWPELKSKYGERFYRMWRFYLLSCAGLFRAREAQLWQVVLSKKGVPGGYQTVR